MHVDLTLGGFPRSNGRIIAALARLPALISWNPRVSWFKSPKSNVPPQPEARHWNYLRPDLAVGTKGWAILENLWRPSLDGRTYDQLDDQHADMKKWWILSGGTSHCDFLQKLEIATPIFASLIFGSFTNGNDDKPLCWWVNFHPTVGKSHGDSTGFCWCFTTVSYRFP